MNYSGSSIEERLRLFAKIAFGSAAALANALGTRPQALQNYFTGRSLPGADTLIKLSQQGCNTEWLLTGNGSMYADNDAGRLLRSKSEEESEPFVERRRVEPEAGFGVYPGLRELLDDPDERALYQITDEEEALLKSVRFQHQTFQPTKQFFVDVLRDLRRRKARNGTG